MTTLDAEAKPAPNDWELIKWNASGHTIFKDNLLASLSKAAAARQRPPQVPTMLSGAHWAWHPLPGYLQQEGYDSTVNIGVVGTPGSGKSSLVNALRRKCPRDEGAAPVGSTKTTTKPIPYYVGACQSPGNQGDQDSEKPVVRIWDLPGIDSDASMDDASRDLGLLYFDAVLVVCGRSVTDTDKMIMGELHYLGVPSFVVRMKVDMDVNNEAIDNKTSEQETIRRLRECFSQQEFNCFFLVSARKVDKYDLKRLVSQIYATIHVRRYFEKNTKDCCPICSDMLYNENSIVGPYTCSACNTSICASCAAALLEAPGMAPCPACLETLSTSGGWIGRILPSISLKMLCLC